MSDNKERITIKQINVPDDTDGTHILTEYGCRFPDGHKEWGTFIGNNGVPYDYGSVIVGSGKEFSTGAVAQWQRVLQNKAAQASIHPAEYAEDHTFVKRTVILVTTKAEEVN